MSATKTPEADSVQPSSLPRSSRPRRLLAALAAFGMLTVAGCSGGDAIPDEPAEEAGTGSPGGEGPGTQGQPAGTPGISDPTDDLTEPTPGS